MSNIRYFFIVIGVLFVTGAAFAQKTDRDFIRRGNKLYEDSLFVKAEVAYRKALELNPKSVAARFNLGNTLLMQQKAEDAMKQFADAASMIEKDGRSRAISEEERLDLAKIYHNMGVILQSNKQYEPCIEAYKNSLRNNPYDHETRYNLTLAQKMKKQQEEQQQNQEEQNQEQNQEQEQKQDQQNQEQKQDQQQQEQQQQQQEQQNEMSKENAEQMLKAIMQDEKEIQDKVKKAMQEVQPRKFEKDW